MVQSLPILETVSLIPQRAPMVLVDALYEVSPDGLSAMCGLHVKDDNIFCDANGRMSESGILEHVAQCAALRMGYLCSLNGAAVPRGYIGSFNKVRFSGSVHIGDLLHTMVKVEYEVMGITLTSFEVSNGDAVVAQGQMKVGVEVV